MSLTLKKASVVKAIATLEDKKKVWEKARAAKVAEYQKEVQNRVPSLLTHYEACIAKVIADAKAALAKTRKAAAAVLRDTTEQNIAAFNAGNITVFGRNENGYGPPEFDLPDAEQLFGTVARTHRIGRRWETTHQSLAEWPGEAQLTRLKGLLNLFSGPECVLSSALAEKLLGSDESILSLLA